MNQIEPESAPLPRPPKNRYIWVSIEDYARIMNRPLDIPYYKLMCRRNLDRQHGPRCFHPSDIDVKRGSYRIKYSEDPIIDGETYPRILRRP